MTEKKINFLKNEISYLKEQCISAGEELEKHSFAWDGKEKNLCIQAMHLNDLYEQKMEECEKLKILLKQQKHNYSEAVKYIQEIAKLLGINSSTTARKLCICGLAVLTSTICNQIKEITNGRKNNN